MNTIKIAAIILIASGIMGLVVDKFVYTKDIHKADLGPVAVQVRDVETVNIPLWAGVGAIGIGGLLLLLGCKGRCAIQ